MIPVYLHYQNRDGNAMNYRSVMATVRLPAVPSVGETLFTCDEVQKTIIGAILKKPERIIIWENLIVDGDEDRPALLSLQEYFIVKERWFFSEDSSIHILMSDSEGDSPRRTRTDEEILALRPQLEESYAKEKWWY